MHILEWQGAICEELLPPTQLHFWEWKDDSVVKSTGREVRRPGISLYTLIVLYKNDHN